MDMLWNLDKLYKSFDDAELKTDFAIASDMITELQKICSEDFSNSDDADSKLSSFIVKSNKFADLITNIYSFASNYRLQL